MAATKNKTAGIGCRTFQKQERVIGQITAEINEAEGVSAKADLAEKLRRELDVLLACRDYDDDNADCRNCRFITDVRNKTAGLILKAKRLA